MFNTTTLGSRLTVRAWLFWFAGWTLFFASIGFARGNNSSDPPFVVPFWFSFALLVAVSMAYLILQMTSEVWKSKLVRFFFSPYLIGAACWLLLILLTFLLDSLGG